MIFTDGEIQAIATALTGSITAILAWFVFRLNAGQREDAWLQGLWEFHRIFWFDDNMAKVRAWIANDEAYTVEIKNILAKRMNLNQYKEHPQPLSSEEYKKLEILDKFAALIISHTSISPPYSLRHKKIRERLFNSYWINQITLDRRPELRTYLDINFNELFNPVSFR